MKRLSKRSHRLREVLNGGSNRWSCHKCRAITRSAFFSSFKSMAPRRRDALADSAVLAAEDAAAAAARVVVLRSSDMVVVRRAASLVDAARCSFSPFSNAPLCILERAGEKETLWASLEPAISPANKLCSPQRRPHSFRSLLRTQKCMCKLQNKMNGEKQACIVSL